MKNIYAKTYLNNKELNIHFTHLRSESFKFLPPTPLCYRISAPNFGRSSSNNTSTQQMKSSLSLKLSSPSIKCCAGCDRNLRLSKPFSRIIRFALPLILVLNLYSTPPAWPVVRFYFLTTCFAFLNSITFGPFIRLFMIVTTIVSFTLLALQYFS